MRHGRDVCAEFGSFIAQAYGHAGKPPAPRSWHLIRMPAGTSRWENADPWCEPGMQPMPDNASGAWDLIVAPWHLDEHIPDFPAPAGTVAAIGPPLPDGGVPGRV